MQTGPFRIGILEDDPDLRQWLVGIIDSDERLTTAFAIGTLAEAHRAISTEAPDLCLVDINLPDGTGIEFIERLKSQSSAKSLILTVLGDRLSVLLALQAGADGYLLKDTPGQQLRNAIHSTLEGETPLSPQAATFLLEMWKATDPAGMPPAPRDREELTSREIEVLKLFSRGLSYREVAHALNISPNTVGDHVKAIHRKLRVHSRSEAIFEARQLGLISPLG